MVTPVGRSWVPVFLVGCSCQLLVVSCWLTSARLVGLVLACNRIDDGARWRMKNLERHNRGMENCGMKNVDQRQGLGFFFCAVALPLWQAAHGAPPRWLRTGWATTAVGPEHRCPTGWRKRFSTQPPGISWTTNNKQLTTGNWQLPARRSRKSASSRPTGSKRSATYVRTARTFVP